MERASISQLLQEVHQKRADEGLNPGPWHQLVVLNCNQTLGDALHKLHAHKIISAPIQHKEGKWAILDMLDVALAVSNAAKYGLDVSQLFGMKLADCYSMISLTDSVAMPLQHSVLEALAAMVTKDLHRVIIVDPEDDNKPVGVVSQMDIVRFVVKHWDKLDRSVRAHHIASIMKQHLVTVEQTALVSAAIELCAMHRYSGVGIVDGVGHLVGNFSISDLRAVNATQLPAFLKLTVTEFLHQSKKMLVKDLISCKSNTTLADAAKLMLQHHVHRLFVQDDPAKLAGMVSATDLCAFLAKALKL